MTGVGVADTGAVGVGLGLFEPFSPFLQPATTNGNTDKNTNKQRRIQICRRYITLRPIVKCRFISDRELLDFGFWILFRNRFVG